MRPKIDSPQRSIRVFISSTFSDMRQEREYLNKHIFPSIRRMCEIRGVIFSEIDLQWGITENQAKNGGAIEICLNEIDNCRPYFIGLLGERYGWRPIDAGVKAVPIRNTALKQKVLSWLQDGESVTAMEMIHGVLDDPEQAPYSYFYFRNPELTAQLAGSEEHIGEKYGLYYEQVAASQEKLTALKSRITTNTRGWHVRNKGGGYRSIENLGRQVREDLERAINERFPEIIEASPLERERSMHSAFARSRLSTHIAGGTRSYIADEDTMSSLFAHFSNSGQPVIVTGETGAGKSALLANFADRWRVKHPGQLVIEHYAGAGGESSAAGALRRVMAEIKEYFILDRDIPLDDNAVYADFGAWLKQASPEKPMLIVLDGVNQLVVGIEGYQRLVESIPNSLPNSTRLILSSLEGEVVEAAQLRHWKIVRVSPLSRVERMALISAYLRIYRKTLPEPLLEKLANSSQSHNPLFLRIVLDELRVDVTHEQLSKRLSGYLSAENPTQLFLMALTRWERDYQLSNVPRVMGLLYASRYGLSDHELRTIGEIQPMMLSGLLCGMGSYLANRDGLLGFLHDALRQAVKLRYIDAGNDGDKQHRADLAGYFLQQEVSSRQVDELPWQLQGLGQVAELSAYLKRLEVLQTFASRPYWHAELMFYWGRAGCCSDDILRFHREQLISLPLEKQQVSAENLASFCFYAGYYIEAEIIYRDLWEILTRLPSEDELEVTKVMNSLGLVLDYLGRYNESEDLHQNALRRWERTTGENSKEVAMCLRMLGLVTSHQGKYQKAEDFHRKALRIRTEIFGLMNLDTAQSINNLALVLENRGEYSEAEQLHRQALTIFSHYFGDLHHEVARCLNNLATVLIKNAKLVESEQLQRKSLEIRKMTIGDKHPDYARGLNSLGFVLDVQGKYDEAERAYRQALEIYLHSVGMRHVDTAYSIDGLGVTLQHLGRIDEAEEMLRQGLEIRQEKLGDMHPDTAQSLSHLGALLLEKKQLSDARLILAMALKIRRNLLGPEHPATVDCTKLLQSCG